jgi:hypothetical protein
MAGAAGVDNFIWLSEILRRGPLAKLPEFLAGEILGLGYSSQTIFPTFGTAIDFQIIVSIAHSGTALFALRVWRR